jgi:hypothetical protein
MRERSEYILLGRFDDTDIPGIRSTTGYIDLRKKSPEEFAAIILRKLGIIKPDQLDDDEFLLLIRDTVAERLELAAKWKRSLEYDWRDDHSPRLRDSFLGEFVTGKLGRAVEPNGWCEFCGKYSLTPEEANDVIEFYFDESYAHQSIQDRLQALGCPIPPQSEISPAHVMLIMLHLYLIEKQSLEKNTEINAYLRSSTFYVKAFHSKTMLASYEIAKSFIPDNIKACIDEFISMEEGVTKNQQAITIKEDRPKSQKETD